MRANFIISEVLNGFRRNVTMTIAMILTTAITLGMFGGGLLVIQMADKSQQIFLDRVEMQFFVNDAVSDADPNCQESPCAELRTDIENEPGVGSVTFIDREEAFEAAKQTFKDNPDIANNIREGTIPASLKVRMSDPAQFGAVLDKYKDRKDLGVDGALDQRELVQRIFSVLDGTRNAAFAVALVLAVAAILLIVNTVQIAAFTRRTEVSIMRLVGATRWYTQLPFLLEAVVAALVGAFLAIGGLFAAKVFFFDNALRDLYGVNILARIGISDVLFVSPWLILAGILLSGVTSYVTLRVYVRE
ncbi:permease-like cell division protein FtsX [Gordonia sp. Z-3]|jgi:cell division transport system permease protein|uniref:Cell division protein FtsX n=2 Tax=Gordonia TaxID=2053 RepID=A0A9X3I6Y9_9ACTN|nr:MULTISPECIES: permease-like cell division protein FtsX [Gordonia]MAU84788.1 cell division protein FtsX [Gordonia sp. (in: high G+C Gram-positive bacteria)]MCF3939831.1 permease-like cell division protein FtsX [Gordonia tangerina]MCX2966540.1 permease-like cell division protein FtsX [Gordonia aquimaris]MED5799752.1 permease-like cell division protein FtsX [Gordonia sp. Z-3]